MEDIVTPNLPAKIASGVAGIPAALVPASLKALDRLVGAAIDIPVAWLEQKKAAIVAQTKSFGAVEEGIALAAAADAAADPATVQRAARVLVRKEYRQQVNREAVVAAMLEDLTSTDQATEVLPPADDLDADWLNVFERYAEDASSERMQKLWGRVLGGEIRKPGRFSMRTLRFLSEFSQADALLFSDFCLSAFGPFAPKSLVRPEEVKDIKGLLQLEAAGLIQGVTGLGLETSLTLGELGVSHLVEGPLAIQLHGKPGERLDVQNCPLTPLGQELIHLLPGRDPKAAARKVATAIRSPAINSAYLVAVVGEQAVPMEVLWQPDDAKDIAPVG